MLPQPSAPSARADVRSAAVPQVVPGLPGRSLCSRLTSAPVLVLALVGVTLLAAGPVQAVDDAAHRPWARLLTPGAVPFIQNVLDPIAGQAVCLPVLVAVAVPLAWRHRTWQPIWCVAAAEAAFYGGVGLLKVVLARPAPVRGDPDLFDGGLQTLGWSGISFPSGHAAEAVLVYGTAVHLVARWTSASDRALRVLRWGVGAVTVNAVAVSYYLGWHWITDLVGGVLVGGLLLRLLVAADRTDWAAAHRLRRRATSVTMAAWRRRATVRGGPRARQRG
ncbi:phosphatase PAP2 family protein [Isoptericola sp. BMS4]|uniref:phosphatase PAP2 family protein n=1 Tax=Isoptericola sp. BMS4 TaxID=2527875 RepID=UPI00141E1ED6|nr:phosphatase PAP2 family protein [Isoptericola sp. BMS4]